jgi:hypothetical protein
MTFITPVAGQSKSILNGAAAIFLRAPGRRGTWRGTTWTPATPLIPVWAIGSHMPTKGYFWQAKREQAKVAVPFFAPAGCLVRNFQTDSRIPPFGFGFCSSKSKIISATRKTLRKIGSLQR